MRYAKIEECEVNNGEGVGCSLFVQGCHFHCKNCFNQEAWDFSGGEEWTKKTWDKLIKIIKKPYIKRFSVLGGEPLANENLEMVFLITYHIKQLYPEIQIWLYTGYTLEDIFNPTKNDTVYDVINNIQRQYLLENIDVLIDGQYVDELRDLSLPFRGSSNQRLIDMQKTIQSGKIVLIDKL